MIIYVLDAGEDYYNYYIVGIFSSKEKAEEYVNNNELENPTIVDYELDKGYQNV